MLLSAKLAGQMTDYKRGARYTGKRSLKHGNHVVVQNDNTPSPLPRPRITIRKSCSALDLKLPQHSDAMYDAGCRTCRASPERLEGRWLHRQAQPEAWQLCGGPTGRQHS